MGLAFERRNPLLDVPPRPRILGNIYGETKGCSSSRAIAEDVYYLYIDYYRVGNCQRC